MNKAKHIMSAEERKAFVAEYVARAKADAEVAKKRNQIAHADMRVFAEDKLRKGRRLNVVEFEALTGVMFSHMMDGKMKNVLALSTNCMGNPRCIGNRMNDESVCVKCFAWNNESFKATLRENTSYNLQYLSKHLIPKEMIPIITDPLLRTEAFGDSSCVMQSVNYLNIGKVNEDTTLDAIWTKSPDFYYRAVYEKGAVKGSNTQLIYSSPNLNHEVTKFKKGIGYGKVIDKVFTVYTLKWLDEHHIDPHKFINCGARSCYTCRRCYQSAEENLATKENTIVIDGIEYVRELEKGDAQKLRRRKGKMEMVI